MFSGKWQSTSFSLGIHTKRFGLYWRVKTVTVYSIAGDKNKGTQEAQKKAE